MRSEQLQALGLAADPFELDPRGHLYFVTPALRQRLDLLHHLVQDSDLALVVSAPPGGGKTAFLDQLLAGARDHWHVCRLEGTGALGVRTAVARVLAALGARAAVPPPPEVGLARLAEQLEGLARAGEIAVVAVDDADRLEPAALALFLELAARSELEARVVLTGAPPFARRVTEAVDGPVHAIELPPFDREQTADYLRTRLLAAGMQGDSPLTPGLVERIHAASGGLPGAIHRVARERLGGPGRVAAAAPGAALGGELLRWWKGLAVVAVALALVLAAIVLLPATVPPEGPLAPPPRIVEAPPAGTGAPAAPPAPIAGPAAPPAPSRIVLGDPSPPADPDPGSAPPSDPGSAPPSDPASDPPSDPASAPPSDPPSVRGSAPEPGPPPELAGNAAPEVLAEPPPEPPPAPRAEPRAVPRTGAGPAPRAGSAAVHGPGWLRQRDPDHYTIQLVGTHDEAAMWRFIRAAGHGGDVAWYRTLHQGRPWFVVVHGVYPDRGSALRAIAALPASLRGGGRPWPRPIRSVHEALR